MIIFSNHHFISIDEKRTIKFFLELLLVFTLAIQAYAPAHAYDDAKDHYADIELVLFENREYKKTLVNGNAKTALQMLEEATALAIDQFGNTGESKLNNLKEYGVPNVPKGIEEIRLSSDPDHHQSYTHLGWDFIYGKEDKANWPKRKEIILSTVNKIFGFSFLSGTILGYKVGYDKKCESFSALIYYVHVIGDHIDSNKKKENDPNYRTQNLWIPLVRDNYGRENTPSIIDDLLYHVEVFFAENPGNANVYRYFIQELKNLRADASVDIGKTAGLSSNAYAEDLRKLLSEFVPILLKKDAFFQTVFFPERM